MKNTIKRRVAIVAAVVAAMVIPAALVPADAAAVPLGQPTSTNNEWLSFTNATPGMAIGMDIGQPGRVGKCTAGPIGKKDGKFIMLTAGHCHQEDMGTRVRYATKDKNVLTELGHYTKSQDIRSDGKVVDFKTDFAIIEIKKGTTASLAVAGKYRVDHVVDPLDLREGMEVCKYGFRTEETCGQVDYVNGNIVRVNLFSKAGDSGSPAYIKLGNNRVALVGLLSGSPCKTTCDSPDDTIDGATNFALLAPILEAEGINVIPSEILRD